MIRTVLRTEHVTMQFGGVIAVNDLNIVVKEHEIIALIVYIQNTLTYCQATEQTNVKDC